MVLPHFQQISKSSPYCNLRALRIRICAISGVIIILMVGLSGNGVGVPVGSSS